MNVWIDLANSPHVPLLRPVVEALRQRGDRVLLTARDHAQTLELAERSWPDVRVVRGQSPGGRAAKGLELGARALALAKLVRGEGIDAAFSHGSYAQVLAARSTRIPSVVMMDYEHQPANHLSFRLARRVIVPTVFPERALRRLGGRRKAVRYPGFKEELYLAAATSAALDLPEVGAERVLVVMRPPPDGALYHRSPNHRFDEVLEQALGSREVQVILLPRSAEQRRLYGGRAGVIVPAAAVDGKALLGAADLVIGGGGTMNREAALLGTPTYTVFGSRLAAVDAELIRLGHMVDLRDPAISPRFEKKGSTEPLVSPERSRRLLDLVLRTISDVSVRS